MSTIRSTRLSTRRSTCRSSIDTSRQAATRTRITLVEAVVLLTCVASLVFAFSTALQEPVPADVPTAPVRVQTAQTLWDLAVEHPVDGLTTAQTIEFIQQLNGKADSSLAAGEVVLVPQVDDQSTALASR